MTYLTVAFWLSLAGVLFSGYLSGHRLFLKQCAFGESCPYFFGVPACFLGFLLFVILFAIAAYARYGSLEAATAFSALKWISLAGVLYAGYLTFGEVAAWISSGASRGTLILPTCSYGLVVFAALFATALAAL